jgi:hypothetical protein
MKQETENYIKKLKSVRKTKLHRIKLKIPLQITTTPEVVWEKCCMDTIGPLTVTTEGHKYILTFQDDLSKYTLAVRISKQDAVKVAKFFVEEIVLKFEFRRLFLQVKV